MVSLLEIKIDDLTGSKIIGLITEHLEDMAQNSPPESRHALNVEGLKRPDVTFWSAWEQDELLGCGALKHLNNQQGEIKSMRTARLHLRKGVSKHILSHLIEEAKKRGYKRISLETGSMDFFEPARSLYKSFGFEVCEPFANYKEDPNNVFMSKEL